MAKYSYNGVILPEIPADIVSSCSYILILKAKDGGNIWVYGSTSKPYYRLQSSVDRLELPSGRHRSLYSTQNDSWGSIATSTSATWCDLTNTWSILWSSYDVPSGSSTATSIYFKGSTPIPIATINYDGTTLTEFEGGQTIRLCCEGKKAASDIVMDFSSVGSITYDGVQTDVNAGKTTILFCAGKKMQTDILIRHGYAKQYFTLQQGQINIYVANNYITSNTKRASYVGTGIELVPGAQYILTGVDGVRYGVQTITKAGLAELQAGSNLTSSNKLDSGWKTSGYTFTADANAAACWLTASYSDNSAITPSDAMPVYIQRIS